MSKLFSLEVKDFIKGLVVTVLTAVLSTLYQLLSAGGHIDWKSVGGAAILSGLAYLIKQLGTDTNGKLLGKV